MAGFNIPLGADTTPLERDMAKASQITQRSSELMAQSIGVVDAKQKLLNQTLATQLANVQKLSLKYGENSTEALKMASAAERTRMQLAQMVAPTGNIGSVAQKSAGGFNALGNSVNQLTREMPAFANSAQTGFMAISNNLPIFFDAINGIKKQNAELVASGQPAVSVMGALGSAIFSWGTALSLGVTALTLFGPQLIQLTSELFTNSDAYDENNKNAEIFTAILNKQNIDIANGNRVLTERIRLLGIELSAAQKGISVKEETINYEKNRLANMQRIMQDMLSQTQTFEVNGVKVLAGKYASMIEPYQKRIEQQKERIEKLKQELDIETKIDVIRSKPIVNKTTETKVKTPLPDYLKNDARAKIQDDYVVSVKKFRKNLVTELKPIPLKNFLDTNNLKPTGEKIGINLSDSIASGMQSGAQLIGQTLAGMFTGQNTGETFFSGLISIIADFMNALGGAMIAAGLASDVFQKSLFTNPYLAIAAGAGLMIAASTVKGIMTGGVSSGGSSSGSSQRNYGWQESNMPKMAEGGLLYGKTAFIGGEYAGASSNPEVVAPLNKLKSIIGGSGGGMLSADLSGRTIKFALVRENKYRSQNFGR